MKKNINDIFQRRSFFICDLYKLSFPHDIQKIQHVHQKNADRIVRIWSHNVKDKSFSTDDEHRRDIRELFHFLFLSNIWTLSMKKGIYEYNIYR